MSLSIVVRHLTPSTHSAPGLKPSIQLQINLKPRGDMLGRPARQLGRCTRSSLLRLPWPTTMLTGKLSIHLSVLPLIISCSDAVETRGQFVAAGRSAGNENRRWHGTHRQCNLGDSGHTQFCSSTTCSLCCIVRTSFDLSLFGKKTGWGRWVCLYTLLTTEFKKQM